jgi:hypothetical protein
MAELYKIGVEIALAGTILQGLEGIFRAESMADSALAVDDEGGDGLEASASWRSSSPGGWWSTSSARASSSSSGRRRSAARRPGECLMASSIVADGQRKESTLCGLSRAARYGR